MEEIFNIQEENGEFLILPAFGVGNSAWQNWNDRWKRSLHIDSNNNIISCGFPKFCNLGEGVDKYNVTVETFLKYLNRGLVATLKIDGSLLIRFVHNGKVRFRTRGSFKVGVDNAFEIDEFVKKYPKLNDPTLYKNMSLLFEWVSPLNPIVIKYDIPDITLIGAITHNPGHYEKEIPTLKSIKELKSISDHLQIPLVKNFSLNSEKDVNDLIQTIKSEKTIEGFVIRFNNEQELVKVKSDHYKILHALKSHLTTVKLIELWQSFKEPDYKEFEEKFIGVYDYETWEWSLPVISSMFDGIKIAQKIINHVKEFVEINKNLDRKSFALLAQKKYNNLNLSLCFILYTKKPIPNEMIKKFILQHCKQTEKRMFEA